MEIPRLSAVSDLNKKIFFRTDSTELKWYKVSR